MTPIVLAIAGPDRGGSAARLPIVPDITANPGLRTGAAKPSRQRARPPARCLPEET